MYTPCLIWMLEKYCTVRYLVVVGVEILDDVDADDDVETELDVDALKGKRKIITVRTLDVIIFLSILSSLF